MGTVHLLELAEDLSHLEALVVATTDKVYDDRSPQPYAESSPLGGLEPYSASKVATEMVVQSWPTKNLGYVTARAGNVIGGGDFAEYRLIPDLVRAWTSHQHATIRNPGATRPWQHVLEPLRGYLLYAEALSKPGISCPSALNFGPSMDQVVTVQELAHSAAQLWQGLDGAAPKDNVYPVEESFAEAASLSLDSSAAAATLGWTNILDWHYALRMTIDWYYRQSRGELVKTLILEQIDSYCEGLTLSDAPE